MTLRSAFGLVVLHVRDGASCDCPEVEAGNAAVRTEFLAVSLEQLPVDVPDLILSDTFAYPITSFRMKLATPITITATMKMHTASISRLARFVASS